METVLKRLTEILGLKNTESKMQASSDYRRAEQGAATWGPGNELQRRNLASGPMGQSSPTGKEGETA